MSYVSSVVGGGSQVGDQMSFMDVGTSYAAQDGSTWLRNGVWVTPASAPIAATIPYLQATGQASATLPTALSTAAFDIATDGAGKWVIAYGSATNVLVSTDSGATWANVAHNAGGVVTTVCWTTLGGGLFVCGGNSSTLFLSSTATAASVATTWTARTSTAITGGTADTTRIRSSSAEVIMVCGGGTTGCNSRSTNGTTWTAANIASALSSTNSSNGLTSLGGGVWVTTSLSTNGNRSTDGGVTWASVAYPAGIQNSCAGGGVLIAHDNAGVFYSSTTGATGSFTLLGKVLGSYIPFSAAYGLSITHNGSVFIASAHNSLAANSALGFYATSANGSDWAVKTAIGRRWADGASNGVAVMMADSTGGYVMASPVLGGTLPVIYGNISTTTGVGMNRAASSSSTSGVLPPTTQYVRIT